MSLRILIVDRLQEVARKLEASSAYAVPWEDGKLNWADPIHVLRDSDVANSPRSALIVLKDLSAKSKRNGSAFEISPGIHALLFPVPFKGKQVALGCVMVRADDRLAYYMLQLAKIMLQRDDYSDEGVIDSTDDE
jgi:hypothetical protein